MASDVAQPTPPMFAGVSLKGTVYIEDTPEESRDFQKIINLRNEIYTWKHPRFKPSSISRPTHSESPATTNNVPNQTLEKNKAPPATPWTRNKTPVGPSTGKSQIDDVLLTKSEVLIKAETSLKRQRIEQELKHQLEQRKHETKTGIDIKDGHAVVEEDVDIEAVMSKAGIRMKPVERPEDLPSASRLKSFGDKTNEAEIRTEIVPNPGAAGAESLHTTTGSSRPSEARPAEIRPVETQLAISLTRTVETLRERDRRPLGASSFRRDNVPPPPPPPPQPQAPQPERIHSPQPRYSATSQVKSPAAPQPVRPANMARVESQDHIREIENGSNGGYTGPAERASPHPPIYPTQVPTKRTRQSPEPYIKQEPIPSPFPRDDYARRQPSPGMRPPSRGSVYHNRPPYDYPVGAVHDYRYQQPQPPPAPPPPQHRHQFDPYPYREDPYAYPPPPPIEYRRPAYPPAYPPPSAAAPYYPPRPIYDDYPPPARYSSRPPVLARQPPIRRSASPPVTYKRQRRDSRSISPDRRERRLSPGESNSPGPMNMRQPGGSPTPTNTRRARPVTTAARALNDEERGESTPQRGEPMVMEYACPPPPRERAYYDGRDPYYGLPPPPPPARYDEPFLTRPESGMLRRDGDWRSYRERDYPFPPQARPAVPLGAPPYPPPSEYARAPSMAPPSDALEYSARAEYYGRPEGRDADGRGSVRPEERAYPPPRQQSVRPDAPDFYGERSYRSASVRPDLERERYSIPPPMPPPPPGYYGRPPYDEGGYRR